MDDAPPAIMSLSIIDELGDGEFGAGGVGTRSPAGVGSPGGLAW